MSKKILLLIIVSFLVAVGGFGILNAQDPQPQNVRTDPPTVSAQATQTDLSGTYTGTFNCEALGLTGPTTLTITGNQFTTEDGKSGRIVASTTGGYTAVVLQMGGTETAPTTTPSAPVIVSMRGRKSGNRLTLTPAPGSAMKCSFVPGRGVARGRRGQTTPPATGTEVANPAATPAESPMPSQTPEPSPEPSPMPTPEPSPTPTPEPSPTPTPEPVPSPTPSPESMPSPTPSPSEPVPSPPASPTPTPTPTPTPRPGA